MRNNEIYWISAVKIILISEACAYLLCSNLVIPTHHSTRQDGTSGTKSMNNQRMYRKRGIYTEKQLRGNPFGNDQ